MTMPLYNKKLPVGKMVVAGDDIIINEFGKIEISEQQQFLNTVKYELNGEFNYLYEMDHLVIKGMPKMHLPAIDKALKTCIKYEYPVKLNNKQGKPTPFDIIERSCKQFSDFLQSNQEKLFSILMEYECYNAFIDELNRSIDFLQNIRINKAYFIKGKIEAVASFLPLNQPIYSLVCFGIIPSLLSDRCHVRPPGRCQDIFKRLIEALKLFDHFPNIEVNFEIRSRFIEKTKGTVNAVIFTGNPSNGHVVRKKYPPDVLFIFNGAGHNPLIIAENADIEKACESIVRLCFLNQGQDCAAPNSIMVHESVYDKLKEVLVEKVESMNAFVGHCSNKSNLIGPNTERNYALKIAKEFARLKASCLTGGCINVVTNIIYPTIFEIPLKVKPALKEFFAPVIVLQKFFHEEELTIYFNHPKYKENAMYVTLFGYISQNFIHLLIDTGLHTVNSVLINTDLHLEEKGYNEYGGNGPSASCIYFNGQKVTGATLPQRDIYKYLIEQCPNIEREG